MQTLEIMPDRTTVNDPLEIILEKEKTKEQMGICNTTLSEFEKQVLYMRLNGESQSEIAKNLNKDVKSIDNTIQRIKGKLK
jgi:RNA polymerase sporulation-specific sigma factor